MGVKEEVRNFNIPVPFFWSVSIFSFHRCNWDLCNTAGKLNQPSWIEEVKIIQTDRQLVVGLLINQRLLITSNYVIVLQIDPLFIRLAIYVPVTNKNHNNFSTNKQRKSLTTRSKIMEWKLACDMWILCHFVQLYAT